MQRRWRQQHQRKRSRRKDCGGSSLCGRRGREEGVKKHQGQGSRNGKGKDSSEGKGSRKNEQVTGAGSKWWAAVGGVTGSGEVTHKYKPGTCGIDAMLAKHTFKGGGSAKAATADTWQSFRNTLHHAAPPCNILHYTEPHSNTLQHTAASYHRARWSTASSGAGKCSRAAHCEALFAGLFNASATIYLGRDATW